MSSASTFGHALVIGLAVAFLVQVVVAVALANYAANRGYPFGRVLLCCLFAPWPLAFLLIILASDREPGNDEAPGPRMADRGLTGASR